MSWFEDFPYSRITGQLWLGNYANATSLAEANLDSIEVVLNVHDEPLTKFNPDISYFHVPFFDGEAVPKEALIACMMVLLTCYKGHKRTLVHCAAGISRSPTMVAAFLEVSGQCPFIEGMQRIEARRPIVGPAPLVLMSVKRHLGVWPYDGSMNFEDIARGTKVRNEIKTRSLLISGTIP